MFVKVYGLHSLTKYVSAWLIDWLIDKFRLHYSDSLVFHGGVKQYKTHTRTVTITNYLISYIHYKLKYKIQLPQKQPCTITTQTIYKNKQHNKNPIYKQSSIIIINNYIVDMKT